MKDREVYINMPQSYMKKRKRSMVVFLSSLYLYCSFFLLIKFQIIEFENGSSYILSIALVALFSLASLLYSNLSKRLHNGFEVPGYREIRVFTKREVFFYSLPIIISALFILVQLVLYSCFLGTAYFTINQYYRPYMSMDQRR